MFSPTDRQPFTAAATNVVHHNDPSNGFGQASWWSVAFKHPLYPDLKCVMFAGEDEDYEWFGNLLLQDHGPFMEIVAEFSHMCWLDITELPNSMEIVLDHVGTLLNKPIHSNKSPRETVGFLNEQFQEYAPKHYCHGF